MAHRSSRWGSQQGCAHMSCSAAQGSQLPVACRSGLVAPLGTTHTSRSVTPGAMRQTISAHTQNIITCVSLRGVRVWSPSAPQHAPSLPHTAAAGARTSKCSVAFAGILGAALRPVGVVALADEHSLLSHLHRGNTQIPALDDTACVVQDRVCQVHDQKVHRVQVSLVNGVTMTPPRSQPLMIRPV